MGRSKNNSTQALSRQYDHWSKIYDRAFKNLFIERQRRAIEELHVSPGDCVLDLGVGTGTTLDLYPEDVYVVGLDLSAGMLQKAQKKLGASNSHHRFLIQADALRPPFAQQKFNHVLISHVISVVPDPVRLLNIVANLLQPGGRVVIINHFRSTRKPMAAVEKLMNPLCMKLGWRSDLSLAEVLEQSDLQLAYQFKINPLDIWQIAVLIHQSAPATVLSA